jgi:hypothetical protein
VAYDFVNQSDVRANAQTLATRMLNFLLAHAWTVVMPDGTASTTFVIRPDEQLALLQIGKQVNPSAFASIYNSSSNLAGLAALPVTVDAADVRDSYFKFNLDAINFFDLIRLESNSSLRAQYLAAYAIYRNATKDHMNPHFNMIDRAVNGPDATRDSQTVSYLEQFLQRPSRDVYENLEGEFPLRERGSILQPDPHPVAHYHRFSVAAQPVSAGRGRPGNNRRSGHRLYPAVLDGALLRRHPRIQ